MNQPLFYVYALVAVIIAAFVLKRVITCLMRIIVVVVLIVALAVGYYLFIGQYDPNIQGFLHDLLGKLGITGL